MGKAREIRRREVREVRRRNRFRKKHKDKINEGKGEREKAKRWVERNRCMGIQRKGEREG